MKAVKYLTGLWISLAAVAAACSNNVSTTSTGAGTASTGSGGAAADCPPCVQDTDCAAGSQCAQLGGDSFCAPACDASGACGSGRTCMSAPTVAGAQASLCVLNMGVCSIGAGSSTVTTGSGEMCGSLVGPDITASCASCMKGAANCQPNGCYGGWWCNTASAKCQAPPNPSTCPGMTTTSTSTGAGPTTGAGGNSGTVGANGGTLDTLSFAIVGDTRPPTEGDIANYPTAIITKIWQDIEATNPRPAFAVTTGDYQFSNPYSNQSSAQFDLYLQARQNFSNVDFPTMGNHECTGGTASNCIAGSITQNYTTYISKLLSPIGQSKPYYEIDVSSTMGTWTSKFLFVAANAWDQAQASWLQAAMAKQTTYTFIVRHEGATVTNGPPGLAGSAAIMAQYPYTILIAGHTHEYRHDPYNKQVIVGNGGAPLTGSSNYGYVIARQRHSDNAIQFWAIDSTSGAVTQQFNIKPDGSAAP